MQKLKAFTFIILFAIAALGLSAPSAHAILIEQDLNAPGDKLITLDTATGIEWLDVTATLGLSYNQALGTTFVTAQGFSHATEHGVSALFTNAGALTVPGVFSTLNFDGVQEIILKFGCTGNCGVGDVFPFIQGRADLVPFVPTQAPSPGAQARFDTTPPEGRAMSEFTIGQPKDTVFQAIGNWLIRPSVNIPEPPSVNIPEPSTLILFGVGLAALVGFGRRQRRI